MATFDPVDSWFGKGFQISKQAGARTASRDSRRAQSGTSPASSSGYKTSAGAKAKNIASVIRKAPEVMVKITGSSSGMASVKHHLDYISRNGQVDLDDECGETLSGRDQLKGLRDQLRASQIPVESKKREFLHVVFSMPAGTPEKSMREALASFAKEEFGNRRYVMAFHDDTAHTHVHLCVGTRDIDRADAPRLSPRKADLFRWRQGFADQLREHGVDAAASERRHRFNHQKSENTVVRQVRADHPASGAFNAQRSTDRAMDRIISAKKHPKTAFVGPSLPPHVSKVQEAQEVAHRAAVRTGVRPSNPAAVQLETTRLATLARWQEVADNLTKAGDAALANQVRELMRVGEKPSRSAAQERFDTATAAKARDVSLER